MAGYVMYRQQEIPPPKKAKTMEEKGTHYDLMLAREMEVCWLRMRTAALRFFFPAWSSQKKGDNFFVFECHVFVNEFRWDD